MMMRHGESWHCTNRSCNAAILVQAESRGEGANPRCTCGAAMLFFVLRCCFSFPVPSCSTTRCRIRRRQTSPQALVGSIFVAFSLLRTFFLVPDSPLG